MKKIFSIIGLSVVVCLLFMQLILPISVFAASTSFPSTSSCPPGKICNPIQSETIQELIYVALKFVVELLAVAGVVYIIYTGFLFVKAQGNPKELEVAKKSFFNAIIGMAIILGSWAIAEVIVNTINQITEEDIVMPSQDDIR